MRPCWPPGVLPPGCQARTGSRPSHCATRSLVTELAVETLRATGSAEDDARYIGSLLAHLQATVVGRQVAEIKSRLQRISPVDDADSYHHLFGDLVALEQYYRALREQAMGAQE